MTRSPTPQAVARGLTALFTGLWYLLLSISVLIALLFTWGVNVGVQLGPNGEPNFEAGGKAEMVLPVAFELDADVTRVISADLGRTGAIEDATGRLQIHRAPTTLARDDRRGWDGGARIVDPRGARGTMPVGS